MLNITKTMDGSALTMVLEGRLDTTTAPQLESELKAALDQADTLVLDFEKLEYISSAGLRILLAIQQYMESTGGDDVCVRNANDVVLETMEMTGFRGVINVE